MTLITIGKFQIAITKLQHSQHLMVIHNPHTTEFEVKFGIIQIIKRQIKEFKTIEMPKQGNQLS